MCVEVSIETRAREVRSDWDRFEINLEFISDPFGVKLGSNWAQFGANWSVWRRFGIGSGSIWDCFGVDLGSIRGQVGDDLGSVRVRSSVDLQKFASDFVRKWIARVGGPAHGTLCVYI